MKIRGVKAGDQAFLVDTWSKSVRSRLSSPERDVLTHTRAVAAISRILGRPGVVVRVAAEPRPGEMPDDLIVGWAVAVGATLHFTYVRQEHRRQGVGRLLAAAVLGPGDGPFLLASDAHPGLITKLRRDRRWSVAPHAFVLEACAPALLPNGLEDRRRRPPVLMEG